MRITEKRDVAIQAVRSEMRHKQPEMKWYYHDAKTAHEYLENLARTEPDLIASQYYSECTGRELTDFYRTWERICDAKKVQNW